MAKTKKNNLCYSLLALSVGMAIPGSGYAEEFILTDDETEQTLSVAPGDSHTGWYLNGTLSPGKHKTLNVTVQDGGTTGSLFVSSLGLSADPGSLSLNVNTNINSTDADGLWLSVGRSARINLNSKIALLVTDNRKVRGAILSGSAQLLTLGAANEITANVAGDVTGAYIDSEFYDGDTLKIDRLAP